MPDDVRVYLRLVSEALVSSAPSSNFQGLFSFHRPPAVCRLELSGFIVTTPVSNGLSQSGSPSSQLGRRTDGSFPVPEVPAVITRARL
jgi:hypothetical protein